MAGDPNNLIWIDMEMTGLQPDADRVIEIAMLVTDPQLNVLATGPVLVVHQPDEVLDGMDSWNKSTHAKSGLIEKVRASRLSEAEARTLAFLGKWVAAKASPICGNSICQDRRFLHRQMPQLEQYFHYRNLDVSTIKELARRWAPDVLAGVGKDSSHTALSDVRDSIAELRHYRYFMGRLSGLQPPEPG